MKEKSLYIANDFECDFYVTKMMVASFLISLKKNDIAILNVTYKKTVEFLISNPMLIKVSNLKYIEIYYTKTNKVKEYTDIIECIIHQSNVKIEILSYCPSKICEVLYRKKGINYSLSYIDSMNDKWSNFIYFKKNKIEIIERRLIRSKLELLVLFFLSIKNKWPGLVFKIRKGSHGDGVFFIRSFKNMLSFLFKIENEILEQSGIVCEDLLTEATKYLNFQYLIQNEKIVFLGSSEQILSKHNNEIIFEGSQQQLTITNNPKFIYKAVKLLKIDGYRGLVGVDVFYNNKSFKIMEINCRANFASAFFLHRLWNKEVFAKENPWIFKTYKLKLPFNEFKKVLNKKGLNFNFQKKEGILIYGIVYSSIILLITYNNKASINRVLSILKGIIT